MTYATDHTYVAKCHMTRELLKQKHLKKMEKESVRSEKNLSKVNIGLNGRAKKLVYSSLIQSSAQRTLV